MDKNLGNKLITIATATSLVVGNTAIAAEPTNTPEPSASDLPPGSLAGILSTTKVIHDSILSEPPAITADQIEKEAVEEAVNEALTDSDTNVSENEESPDDFERDFSLAGGLLMADVQTALNVRSLPSMKGEILGQMRPTDTAEIVSYVDGWYEINSGGVHGFVSERYSMVGPDAAERQSVLSDAFITCNVRKLNVRSDASTESEIVEKLTLNDTVIIDESAETVDGWVSIITDDFTGYVSEDFVEINDGELGTAITADEIEADRIRRMEEMRRHNSAIAASSDDVTLLAALLICEAGGSYDGMLAVGGVVMNRLRAGYAGDIRGVIYQAGQFSPVASGKLDRVLASGVSDSSIQAANEALAGVDITGGCLNFRAAFTGHYGTNIGGNVFF